MLSCERMATSDSKNGFWNDLPRPIFAMAPMADVTDTAFRQIIARRGRPHLFMTEFVSVDGLCSRGRPNLMKHLIFKEIERPIVAQVFGSTPELFRKCAEFIKELGFDGIDVNMGCPVKTVTRTGCGAALIKTPELAQEIIYATQEGAADLPVSVKTRIGFSQPITEEWMSKLLETRPAAIILHLRTARDMSNVDARWDEIHSAVRIAKDSDTLLLGNGDVRDIAHADELVSRTGLDGIMLGRAIFGHPWLFDRKKRREDVTVREKLDVMLEHALLYEEIFGEERSGERKMKSFLLMRKHLLAYSNGFNGAKELRLLLQQVNCAHDVRVAIAQFSRGRLPTEV